MMNINLKAGLVLLSAALLTACGKDDDASNSGNPPAPMTTGLLEGSVSPANGASRILLFSGADTLRTTPDAFGDFEFSEVKPGNYQIMAKPYPDHEAPTPAPVTVKAGAENAPVQIQLVKIPIDGLISLALNGTIISGTPLFTPFNNGSISIGNNTDQVYLELPVITGPGTFTNANSDLNVIVLQAPGGERWETTKTQGTVTLTVTSFDPATLKGNATFSFSAPANGSGATGTKTGTNGTLKNTRLSR